MEVAREAMAEAKVAMAEAKVAEEATVVAKEAMVEHLVMEQWPQPEVMEVNNQAVTELVLEPQLEATEPVTVLLPEDTALETKEVTEVMLVVQATKSFTYQ